MAITLTLKGGEKDFNLIWDSAADVPVAVMAESIQEESAPRPLWHQPGGGDGNELVELGYDDARWPLLVQFGPGTDWSELLEELSTLRRVIRQAHAYALGETWADEVYIECRPDGTASKTYYTVKLVEDRSGGFLVGTRVAEVLIDTLALTVTVAGDGYGDAEALNNALRNGHMLIESATAGLAAGLAVHGTPTVSFNVIKWLIGGQSQKATTDNSTSEGVRSAAVAVPGIYFALAYAWVYREIGDDISIVLQENTGTWVNLEAKTLQADDAGGVSDKSYIDANGNTWYRIPVDGTTDVAATEVRLLVYRYSGDASEITMFYVDGVYLETQAAEFDVPEAWADYPQVYNRNDPDSTNPEYVNRLDVWGIPGDRPAWMELTFDTHTWKLEKFYIAKNLQAAIADEHVVECETASGGSTQVDATCSSGEFQRITPAGPDAIYWGLDGRKYNEIWHVLCRMRFSDTAYEMIPIYDRGFGPDIWMDGVCVENADRWELVYVGLIDFRMPDYYRDELAASEREVALTFRMDSSGVTYDYDYILFLSTGYDRLLIGHPRSGWYSAGEKLYVIGREDVIIGVDTVEMAELIECLGQVRTLEPGIMNRLIFAFEHQNAAHGGDDDEARVDYDSELTLSYRPRTRGFLA